MPKRKGYPELGCFECNQSFGDDSAAFFQHLELVHRLVGMVNSTGKVYLYQTSIEPAEGGF
jgi:hypothetical protein